jgi:UDP-glucuronate decarboxylase
MQRCPDISLARRLLDWEPSVGLDAGLARTIAYFDALLSERGSLSAPAVLAAQ